MILKNIRFLITQNKDRELLENIDIRVKNGEIAEISSEITGEDEKIDCSGKLVMPGLINCHTHVGMSSMRGISDDKPLEPWLHEDIFPAEEELTEEDVYDNSRLGIKEMLKTGTTTFNDMYAPEEPTAEAVDETGIRAVLGFGYIDLDGETDQKLEKSREFIEDWIDHPRITPAVNPHGTYTCSREALERGLKQAEEFDLPVHTHLSETEKENQDVQEKHGETPAETLKSIGILDRYVIGAHGVHLTENDKQLLAENNAGISHNPCANLKLGSGIAEVVDLRERGINVGLGTDSVGSNNNLNMFEEMKFASLLQKKNDPCELTAQETLDMATIDAAKVLGLEGQIGSVEEGKKADLVTVSLDIPEMKPLEKEKLISHLVFSFNGAVSEAIVDGELLVENSVFKS